MNKLREKLCVKDFVHRNLYYLIFFLVMLFVLQAYGMLVGSDDSVYFEQLKTTSLLPWVYWRATTWQPRLAPDFLIAAFGFDFPLWRVATALIATFLLASIGKLCTDTLPEPRERKTVSYFICCAFFLIFPDVLRYSVYWYTGSFNYVYPAFYLIIALIPFYRTAVNRPVSSKAFQILAILLSMPVVYSEQTAAVFLCFSLCCLCIILVRCRRVPLNLVLQLVVALMNLGVYFYLGGTDIRRVVEIYWYKDFKMLSLADKLFQGVNWGNYHLLNASNSLMLLLTGLMFITIWRTRNDLSKWVKSLTALPSLLLLLRMLPIDALLSNVAYNGGESASLQTEAAISYFFNPMYSRPSNFRLGIVGLAPSILCLTLVLCIGVCLFLVYQDKVEAFLNTLLYCAALVSMYSISISPTIFASGNRIFFLTDVLMVLQIGMVVKELLRSTNISNEKRFRIAQLALICLASCYVLDELRYGFLT